MSRFLHRRRQGGFTLIELLIVIAIIGIIAALLIPNFLDALNKAKQKKDMSTIRNVGEAWFSWYTDLFSGAAAAGAGTTPTIGLPPGPLDYSKIKGALAPQYIQSVPKINAWGTEFHYCANDQLTAIMNTASGNAAIAIASAGQGQPAPSPSCGNDHDVGTFDPTDYAQDIVWADGQFVWYPAKAVDSTATF